MNFFTRLTNSSAREMEAVRNLQRLPGYPLHTLGQTPSHDLQPNHMDMHLIPLRQFHVEIS